MLENGHSIGEYRVQNQVATSQTFEVYQVREDHAGGRDLWLTLVAPELLPDARQQQEFCQQVKSLIALDHDGILRVEKVAIWNDRVYYVSLQPQGHPLRKSLGKPFAPTRALQLVRQVAMALDCAHRSDLVHGGLKPENIYLHDEIPVLVNLGVAPLLRPDLKGGIDPYYVSPEQVRGEPAEVQSDLYSLGIILYEMLVGEVPIQAEDEFRIGLMHVEGKLAPLPDRLKLLQPLLERMLASNIEDRPHSAGELVSLLEDQLDEPGLQLISLEEPPADDQDPQAAEDTPENEPGDVLATTELARRIEEVLNSKSDNPRNSDPLDAFSMEGHSGSGVPSPMDPTADGSDEALRPIARSQGKGWSWVLGGALLGAVLGIGIFLFYPGLQPSAGPVETTTSIELKAGLDETIILMEQDQEERAAQKLEQLIDAFPEFPQPYNNLASIYAMRGELDNARALLEKALNTDPEYATVYKNLASIYADMARDSYGRALQLDQSPVVARLQLLDSQGPLPLREEGPVILASTSASIPAQAVAPAPVSVSAEVKPAEPERPPVIPDEVTEPAILTAQVETPAVDEPAVSQLEAEPVAGASTPVIAEVEAEEIAKPQDAAEFLVESPADFIRRWANAWAKQDVEAYLGFYADDFEPAGGRSRNKWENIRRSRIARPSFIEIDVDEIVVEPKSEKNCRLTLVQSYRSDTYGDKTRKMFDLVRTDDSWAIAREHSLGSPR